ncbi:MAG: hypothetical protein GYA35_06880 [Thermoanaerobaculaceae bacterium]|nr:hypothetical protein [Thermoanaerobaculaceae bacterium]
MKKLAIFLIVCFISVFSFAKCDFFQVANDCNGQTTTVIAKNDTTSLDIHANWNQGNISYKFQSEPEKLDLLVYANDMSRLYTEITYKNKSAKIYYDINLAEMNVEDYQKLYGLLISLPPSFLDQVQELINNLPQNTDNLPTIKDFAQDILANEPAEIMGIIRWLQYNECVLTKAVGCYTETNWDACFDKIEKECHDRYYPPQQQQ